MSAALGVLREAAAYFALVFGCGFLLGALRTLFLVPRIGERAAELAEMPVMLLVTLLSARWVVRRFAVPPALPRRLGMGVVGLALLVGAELAFVLRIRGLTPSEYLAGRDPVSGAAYLVSLGLFAVMPALVARARDRKGIMRP